MSRLSDLKLFLFLFNFDNYFAHIHCYVPKLIVTLLRRGDTLGLRAVFQLYVFHTHVRVRKSFNLFVCHL